MDQDPFRMDVVYERGRVRAVALPDVQISWMSFMLEQGFEWMIGKGIHRMRFHRARLPDGKVELVIETDDVQPQALTFASVASIETLADAGVLPLDLESKYDVGNEGSILSSEGLKQDLRICDISYGLSDMIAAYFLKGVEKARYQISRENAQLWVDIGMTPDEVREFIGKERDYGPETTIGALPWR